ncbi:hypothetical protein [Staphylococcus kloosii]|jgi:hypothetical protein|uniref:hypothetical protein n=1 Tax=Staphylococcus kloosii TaxID=29384 RepID=UPI00189DD589|nr:hypothetical protein [Staphylococcus kloosii]MBF7023729.1 hypothetical protein [Staphylococcus kloosii]
MTFEDFFEKERQRMERTPIISFSIEDKWIMVMDTDDNIKKLNRYIEETPQGEIPKDYKVYYNTPVEYELIVEGVRLRAELDEKREKERKLINPDIDEDILNIESKQDLIDYLLEQRHSYQFNIIDEYSEDWEVDYAQLKAETEELKKLVDKYL